MNSLQKGFIVPLLLITIAMVVLGSGSYLYLQKQSFDEKKHVSEPSSPGKITEASSTQANVQQVAASSTTTQQEIPKTSYDYCKPDEDPDFKIAREDASYYYYTGNKSISGELYQQNQNSRITFGYPCPFELTKNYVSDTEAVKKDFNIDSAWKNQPVCNLKQGGEASLRGEYTIRVKGFKISKSYIQQYDPRRAIGAYAMSQYQFYVDYERVENVDQKSSVVCPEIVY